MASRPAFNLCLGPDAVLLREHIDAQLAAFPPASGQAWKIRVFWGDAPLEAQFWHALGMQDLFQTPQALILRRANQAPLEQLKKISAALGGIPPQTWPFICLETEYEKGKPKIPATLARLKFYAFALEKGWVTGIPPLDQRGKSSFIKKNALALGLRLSAADLDRLGHFLPQDAGAIRLEMEKLALAADASGRPAPEAVQMLGQEPDLDIFAFLRGLQSGRRPEQIWIQFHKDRAGTSDAGLFGFLGMLLREARQLWQLLAGEPTSLPAFVVESKRSLAQNLGYTGLARIWDLALRADKGVKSGEHSPDQAFEFLLAELFRLFQGGK
ncbi:MAG: DNA polymerase III subunit delta [Desulfovibrionaceae bacterium]|nr:DNA polymerase III subunit delta [Desulfovibrionaceae bacterium]